MKQGKTEKAVFAKLASHKVELNAIDNLRKKFDKNITNFDSSVSKVRNIANEFVDLEGDFDKISNEAKSIQKALADFGVDDSDVRSIASEAERLKGLSNQYVKTLR